MNTFSGTGTNDGGFCVEKDGEPMPLFTSANSLDPRADGYAWGENTEATRLLAFAILWECAGLLIARQFYGQFATEVMEKQPIRPGWCFTLSSPDVIAWLLRAASSSPV
jgi:hypothetical protein